MIQRRQAHRGGLGAVGAGQLVDIQSVARSFRIRSSEDADGALRATLMGEIDIAVEHEVIDRIGRLTRLEERVRLDLSQLRFVDSHGMDAIVAAISEARREGCVVEVDTRVSPSVARVVAFTDFAVHLWP